MTNDLAKRMLWICAVLSVVIGGVLGLLLYGDLEEVRAWNVAGLVFIVLVGLCALAVGVMQATAGLRSKSDE